MFESENATVTYLYLKRNIAIPVWMRNYFVFSKIPVSFLMENNSMNKNNISYT